MRNGIKVYDCDTHLRPTVETIIPYLDPDQREQAPQWGKVPCASAWRESATSPRTDITFVSAAGTKAGTKSRCACSARRPRRNRRARVSALHGRKIAALRAAAISMSRRAFATWTRKESTSTCVPGGIPSTDDADLEMEFIRAQHRYLDDFTSKYPTRLKSLIIASGLRVEDSVKEIRKWSRSAWAVGVEPRLTIEQPLDHPDLDPIWKAADEAGLSVVHHSFSFGFPGYRDLWDNRFIGRLASHPWGAMRAIPSFFGCSARLCHRRRPQKSKSGRRARAERTGAPARHRWCSTTALAGSRATAANFTCRAPARPVVERRRERALRVRRDRFGLRRHVVGEQLSTIG